MIEAGACALQIENQVSDEKQCGHQDGKVTVPHEDFVAKIRACRYAFLELGIDDGIIVARTDLLGAGLTKQIAFSARKGYIGDQSNCFLDCEEVADGQHQNGEVLITRGSKVLRPKRLRSNLYQFREGTGADRCVLDCITPSRTAPTFCGSKRKSPISSRSPAWSTAFAKLLRAPSSFTTTLPSFNWTLNLRQQVFDAWKNDGKDVSGYDRSKLMSEEYDCTQLATEADETIRTFQRDASLRAGIFHHLITLPTYHTAALSTDNLARDYFGDQGMLGYVAKRPAQGNPPGYRVCEAPEHGGLRYRR